MLETNRNRFGEFGGCYVPEILSSAIADLQQAVRDIVPSDDFQNEFQHLLCDYVGRPTPLTEVTNFSNAINGPRIFLKREDLLHTGAHKINNALGQCLLAQRLGKTRIIAETGAGQHGLATATACAHLGLSCDIYMGSKDIDRQAPNVDKMQLLGAKVHAVGHGSQTLKDAVNEALRDWSASYADSHYCLGSALGPHPFPSLVAQFHRIIGEEARRQILEKTQQLPQSVIACVGGGSNAIGMFQDFLEDRTVQLIGVEAGGYGEQLGEHAARFSHQKPGVLHGCYTYVLQNDDGQIAQTASVSAGLDYPAVGPQHAYLHAIERARYVKVSDSQAIAAFKLLSQTEGIIPALESAHALAYIQQTAHQYRQHDCVVINLSGRGDKDLPL